MVLPVMLIADDDGLPIDQLPINSIEFNIDNPYGSLDVPPPTVIKRRKYS